MIFSSAKTEKKKKKQQQTTEDEMINLSISMTLTTPYLASWAMIHFFSPMFNLCS